MTYNQERCYLKVKQIQKVCLFELSWGQGQTISAETEYPKLLIEAYQQWRLAYLSFYKNHNMRGRLASGGIYEPYIDWHAQVVKAEAHLISAFQAWLRSSELYELRIAIIKNLALSNIVQVFISCESTSLAHLPWETWEVGDEHFLGKKKIQIIRTSSNIKGKISIKKQHNRKRTRILAISGDNEGLSFHKEKQILKSASRLLDVNFIDWQSEHSASQIIQKIKNLLSDEKGWDVLFFMGHSNEASITGGEIRIASNVSISMQELSLELNIAKSRGLQLAIFNSCNGLDIADYLINLGISQVVVMREGIHNNVAEEFTLHFCQGLASNLDVYESVAVARTFLSVEKSRTYPSAYLLPSVYCNPEATLFRIPPNHNIIKRNWRLAIPTLTESIALLASISMLPFAASLFPSLFDTRVFTQAVYRNVTAQTSSKKIPPVALVEIDTQSIIDAQLLNSQISPMNRRYLASIIERVQKSNASVISLDFLIDTPQENPPSGDKDLRIAVNKIVNKNKWFIFGTILSQNEEKELSLDNAGIHNSKYTMAGYTNSSFLYVEFPSNLDCRQTCPISYLMALTQLANQEATNLPKPNASSTDLRTQLLKTIDKNLPAKGNLTALKQWRPLFGIQPIIDVSIPPKQVYTKIPAWQLLKTENTDLSKQVVIIAAGDDSRLGMIPGDRSPSPSTTRYWTRQNSQTGGQLLAYQTHHYLTHHFITPIPDILMIGIAAIVGKVTVIVLSKKSLSQSKLQQISAGAVGAVAIYGVAGLQIYISAGLLLPWFFPSSVFLAYVLPAVNKKSLKS